MILLYNFVFVLLSFVLFSLGGWSLIAPFGPALPLNSGYYLLTPRGRPTSPMPRNFRNWLIEEGNRARIVTTETA